MKKAGVDRSRQSRIAHNRDRLVATAVQASGASRLCPVPRRGGCKGSRCFAKAHPLDAIGFPPRSYGSDGPDTALSWHFHGRIMVAAWSDDARCMVG
jgi:hypothetical protein